MIENELLACEMFVVAFIALHDWLPLGKLHNPQGIRAVDSTAKLFRITLLSTHPAASRPGCAGCFESAAHGVWIAPSTLERQTPGARRNELVDGIRSPGSWVVETHGRRRLEQGRRDFP